MNDGRYEQLASLLVALESAMRENEIWECEQPTPTALASQQPFCVDTMAFEQWLKFVFINRLQLLITQGSALPTQCDVAPMAEEAFKSRSLESVVEVIQRLDQLLTLRSQ